MITVAFRLLAPLAHGSFGESAGNATLFRRMTLASAPGMPRIPVVSGNALRGTMRRLIMRELFESVGLNRQTMHTIVESDYAEAWDRLYAAMANGGHLEGAGEATVKPEAMRQFREACPPLSLFGAACYSFLLPGHMSVGHLWPVCRETIAAGLVDDRFGDHLASTNAEELVSEVSQVRHVDREEQDPAASGVTPMPTTTEMVSTGAVLVSKITFARHATETERAALAHALAMVTTLGGKSGSGFGRVAIDEPHDDGPYQAWLADRDRVIAGLRIVAERLGLAKQRAPKPEPPKKGRGKHGKQAVIEVAVPATEENPT